MKILVFIFAFCVVVYLGYQTLQRNGVTEAAVNIKKGSSLGQIAQELKSQDLISSELIFKGLAFISGSANKLQAGEYKLPANLSVVSLIRVLKDGIGANADQEIKILEGWTLADIADQLQKKGIATADFYALAGSPPKFDTRAKPSDASLVSQHEFLEDKPSGATLEGYLFPDTYRIGADATAEFVVATMLKTFETKAANILANAARDSGKSAYDILRVASIVEAEVPHKEDRPIIAGIIWKRLSIRMGLQVDSSVNYITGLGHASLTSSDLKIDSLYNTYKYRGLPPTPIGNPGVNAIEAAITPKESAYLYWLSTKDGTTIFSKTLDEHNSAKARYLK